MKTRRMFVALVGIGLLLVGPLGAPASGAAPDQADGVEVYERDVFVIVGSTLRNPDATTDPAAPLFNNAGANLNVTWGAWSAATAVSRAQVTGGGRPTTKVRLDLAGLVPNGVYSVFYGTLEPDSQHPQCQGVERTLPLIGAKQNRNAPDASSIVARADGTAEYRGEAAGDLFAARQVFFSVIYHSNGATYDPFPNAGEFLTHDGGQCRSSFGDDAMRQLLVLQQW